MERVDPTIRDLINAIILRAIQDYRMQSIMIPKKECCMREKVKNDAEKFIKSEEFEYMCACVNKDYTSIRKILEV